MVVALHNVDGTWWSCGGKKDPTARILSDREVGGRQRGGGGLHSQVMGGCGGKGTPSLAICTTEGIGRGGGMQGCS